MEALRSIIQESLVFRQSRMDNINNDLAILTEILLLCHEWDKKHNDHLH